MIRNEEGCRRTQKKNEGDGQALGRWGCLYKSRSLVERGI